MSRNNDFLKRESTTSKTFNYAKGNVSINITLRNDIKQDMEDFVELLDALKADLLVEIEKVGKPVK
jgi:hypothetical protein